MSASHKDQPSRSPLEGEVVGLMVLALAVPLLLILFIPVLHPDNNGGAWGDLRDILFQWLGWLAWLLPMVLIAYGIAFFTRAPLGKVTRWVLGALLAIGAVLMLQAMIFGNTVQEPGGAGRLATGAMAWLRGVLGLATPLLLLGLVALGLKFMLSLSLLDLLRRLMRMVTARLTDVGHSMQGAIEAKLPGKSGGTVNAHDRTDVRHRLSELRQKLDTLRRLDPKNPGLKEPLDKVRQLQREIRHYDEEKLKALQGDLDTYDLMTLNVQRQVAHDLRQKVEAEAPPEGEQAVKFLKAIVDDTRHELSAFLPSTQASAALENLRRHLVNQILSLGGRARKLESERCTAERTLKNPTIEQLQREQTAHLKRQTQWQEIQDRFHTWQEYEKHYSGWPDLAADFDSGPTEAATRVAEALQKRPLETLRQKEEWAQELAQAIEQEEQGRLLPQDEEDDDIPPMPDDLPEGEQGGLFSRVGHKLSQLIAPPGPEEERPSPTFGSRSQPEQASSRQNALPQHTAPEGAPVPAFAIDFAAAQAARPSGTLPAGTAGRRSASRPVPPSARPTPASTRPAIPPEAARADTPPGLGTVPPSAATRLDKTPPPPSPAAYDDLGLWEGEDDLPFGPPAQTARPAPQRSASSTSSAGKRRATPAPWEEAPADPGERGQAHPTAPTPKGVSRRGAVPLALPDEKLLDPIPNAARNSVSLDTAAAQRKEMINQTLQSFGLQARVQEFARGPTVTRYEIEPAPGEKISRIASLSNDLARALAVGGVRVEAPVPGKSVIGLEVPNAEREPVTFHQAVADNAFKNTRAKLPIILGKSIDGTMMVGDLAKMPHLLVAGSTGSGKSVCVNTIITSLLYKYLPTDLRFVMVDPKMVELTPYDGIPHLVRPVVTNPADAAGVLLGAVAHMERRYKMMSGVGAKNLEQFNAKMRAVGEVELPHLVIIIDELADLMITSPKEVESAIMRLAQMARATGMHLILATQRPSVDILTSLIKVNIPARIAFAVSSSHDSRTILDTTGAERLTGMGDMLFYQPGLVKPLRLQGPYISEAESVKITDELRRMTFEDDFVEAYGADFEGLISSSGPTGDRSQMDFSDPLLRQAALVCIEEGQGSVSRLQRRLSVGHARAGKLMDLLEAMNIVGPHQGSKPREVLITEADLPDYFGK
ncbi:MAG: DNA translocase FtsK [Deinococcus sp.]|uniref:FtsK/SpoIIIE family DNA translocase n=1 Tax=Deinococcus sp. TaxID=47478 RepID=UPI0026DBAB68|nr:DNA translocase FtsK [Deinococcus sp.]MDO4246115.1 DNA translocase FtsK [Deinococcus sp.]